jgi:hypothetical protein
VEIDVGDIGQNMMAKKCGAASVSSEIGILSTGGKLLEAE